MLLAILTTLAVQAEPLQFRPKNDINFAGSEAFLDIPDSVSPIAPDAFRFCQLEDRERRLTTLSPDSTLVEIKPAVTDAKSDYIMTTTFFVRDSISHLKFSMKCLRDAVAVRELNSFDDLGPALSFIFDVLPPAAAMASKQD